MQNLCKVESKSENPCVYDETFVGSLLLNDRDPLPDILLVTKPNGDVVRYIKEDL